MDPCSAGNYGQSGMTAFKELAEESNVCIAKEDSVLSNAEDHAFDDVISNLLEAKQANVVVCFCEGMTVRNLFKAAQRKNVSSRFLFIGSDGWADRTDVVDGLEEVFIGGISVKIKSPYVKVFDEYYFNLKPLRNARNPWFEEFWQHKFNCSLSIQDTTAPGLAPCSGNESLSERYYQDTKMSFVMKAVYTMAHGLHNLQRAVCGPAEGICPAMLPINGSQFRNHLMNVTFDFLNETVSFDSSGDPPGRYEIMNFQRLSNGSFGYLRIGTWDNGTLEMQNISVMFNSSGGPPPTSVCSSPCSLGMAKTFPETIGKVQTCCWVCDECQEGEFLFNETTCSKCPKYEWPNKNKTGCDLLTPQHPTWNDTQVIAGLGLAGLGFLATVFTMGVFICYNHTPVVKASTRELTYIIFVGMMVSYASSLAFLAKPSLVSCSLERLLPGLSFSMIYAALVTKTNRIARILAGNKKIMTRKLRFMSATAQVVITLILISVELVIIITMFVLEPPGTVQLQNRGRVTLECNKTTLSITAPLAWDFCLVMMCTLYAVKTRNLPENFNEAKFIGFSMYTTCVIWLAWVSIYFGSDHKMICMSVCTSLSALVTLVLLFLPKLYIILLRPERNDRSQFKTATTVRCHFGSGKSIDGLDTSVLMRPPGSFMGVAAILNAGHSLREPIMTRLKSALHVPPTPPQASRLHPDSVSSSRQGLKRELSLWSEASGSGGTSIIQARELMLQRAYGSQIDLTGETFSPWSCAHVSVQTTDDLLDPLIPRLRRRIARAVRENNLDIAVGREFFSLTQGWVTSQMEAAKAEKKLLEERKSRGDAVVPMGTEIIREYLVADKAAADEKEKTNCEAKFTCNFCKSSSNLNGRSVTTDDQLGSYKQTGDCVPDETAKASYSPETADDPNNSPRISKKTFQQLVPTSLVEQLKSDGRKWIESSHAQGPSTKRNSVNMPLQIVTSPTRCVCGGEGDCGRPVPHCRLTPSSDQSPVYNSSPRNEKSERTRTNEVEGTTELEVRRVPELSISRSSSLTFKSSFGEVENNLAEKRKTISALDVSFLVKKEGELNSNESSSIYASKKCAKDPSNDLTHNRDLETIIVSIGSKDSERLVRNGTAANFACLRAHEQDNSHETELATSGTNPETHKETKHFRSIRDEIDPIPRPERTQSIRTRRRSHKKLTRKPETKIYFPPKETTGVSKFEKLGSSPNLSEEAQENIFIVDNRVCERVSSISDNQSSIDFDFQFEEAERRNFTPQIAFLPEIVSHRGSNEPHQDIATITEISRPQLLQSTNGVCRDQPTVAENACKQQTEDLTEIEGMFRMEGIEFTLSSQCDQL
ncbi:GPCR family 3 C-terminal protein [Trinorchestia longiramus]|nr:GPCR family 3 C-terminal protein [Trinorchestia longiramus]